MPVTEARDGMAVEPNHVYVIPPNANLATLDGVLSVTPRVRDHHSPIDFFLQSLSRSRHNTAIGVVLSGAGSDGTLGLRAIKAEGGITFAQDTQSAVYGSMPHSAIASGNVDFVLPPEGIARELARIASDPYVNEPKELETEDTSIEEALGVTDAPGPGDALCGIANCHRSRLQPLQAHDYLAPDSAAHACSPDGQVDGLPQLSQEQSR